MPKKSFSQKNVVKQKRAILVGAEKISTKKHQN